MIERIHLLILKEIDQYGSLTGAAKSMHLTQSALSHTIKKLEKKIGTPIWYKKGRSLHLTQAGQYLLNSAKRVLPQLQRIDDVLEQHADGKKGILRIGMECHPCYQWLLTVVKDFLEQYPDADVDVKQRFQFGGMAALFNHDIDILVTPDPMEIKGIVFTPVFDYEQVLVVAKDHPLSQKSYISPEDLKNQVLYTYPVEIERLDIYTLFLLPANCRPKNKKVIEATEIMLQFVAANRGCTTLPRWLVEQYKKQFLIESIQLGPKGINKKIYMGRRIEDSLGSLAESMLNIAVQPAAK
jgi:LysR family transcriptional regulator for metE and metH